MDRTKYENSRRDFLKAMPAVFAAAPIMSHLNIASDYMEPEELVPKSFFRTLDIDLLSVYKPFYEVSTKDILDFAPGIFFPSSNFGFSYQDIFQPVFISDGHAPEFPLDFFFEYPNRTGLKDYSIEK